VAKSRKTGIRLGIERLLIPDLLVRGFEQVPPTREGFGRFRRRSERGFDIIEIAFNKNRTSHFCMHVAQATGKSVWKTVQTLEEQWPLDVDPNFMVFRRGLVFRRWFGVRKYAREGISEAEYDVAVKQAVDYLPVIERYFATGKTTLAMAKFPQGPWDDMRYVGLCLAAVVGALFALLWVAGWLWRYL
jgi:hypothetical protein